MYPDMNRCPQTEAEFTDYFFTLIGRTIGSAANDWSAVLSANYPWNGAQMRIPEGYGPGIRAAADAPFFGLTQQWSGGPKARLFLPTSVPDGLGYYTRNVQYIQDAPGGGFVWSWTYQDGNAYAAVKPAGDGPPTGNTPPTGDYITREECQSMIAEALKNVMSYGERITLKTQDWEDVPGRYVCADREKDRTAAPLVANRDEAGNFETFTTARG